MEAKDLTFNVEGEIFNYRVGAIIINDGKILMVKDIGYPYYYTVGGRVKLGESSADAVVRECFEETGVRFEIDKLAFVHENFFKEEVGGKLYHEIAFFYLMKSPPGETYVSSGTDHVSEILHWLRIDELESKKIFPAFFKTKLQTAEITFEHIVENETVQL
jgi:ADP-ribose pyrophosphatase